MIQKSPSPPQFWGIIESVRTGQVGLIPASEYIYESPDKFSGADIRDLVDRAVELAIRRANASG